MTKVYFKHLRRAGICSEGARRFWKRHELNWTDFLTNGIDAERLEATKDAQALRVVEIARDE